ncbi:MAG: hypothetical protein ACFCUT_21675 [Kiloniellaceae bacterium]
MEKLPLRPLVFVPVYLLLLAVSALLKVPGLGTSGIWAPLLSMAAVALHFTWMFRAVAYASKWRRSMGRSLGVSEPSATVLRFLLMTFLCLGVAVLYKAYLKPAIGEESSLDRIVEMALVLPTLYFVVGMFWISARTLCEAEMGRKASTFSIGSTAILFIYIFIGAPFIYRRLKDLSEPLPGGLAETA